MPKQIVTLDSLGSGLATELFQHELRKVLENMADQNTTATAKRGVSLKVTFSPFKDRSGAEVMIDCSAKLAPVPAQIAGNMFLHKEDGGELQAYTSDARQPGMFDEAVEESKPQNIVRMASQK